MIYLHSHDKLKKESKLTWKSKTIDYLKLRNVEVDLIFLPQDPGYYALYDIRKKVLLASGLGIGRTFFVCFILALGSHMFSKTT